VSASKIDKLVHMANQISDFYAAMPDQEAVESVATHLRRYWTPKMIREIVAFADHGGAGLNPIAARAVEALKQTVTAT
jgi:formate dehydrogenase subunit delta